MINALLKRRMENKKKNRKGFTLVELIVVLVILAILAAVLVPTVTGYIGKAKKQAAESDLKTIITAVSAATTDVIASYGVITGNETAVKSNAATYGSDIANNDKLTELYVDDSTGTVLYALYTDGSYVASYSLGEYKSDTSSGSSHDTYSSDNYSSYSPIDVLSSSGDSEVQTTTTQNNV